MDNLNIKREAKMRQSNGSFEEEEFNEFVSSVTSDTLLRVEEKLGYGFVRLKVAEAERRQAYHDIRSVEDITRELVRNSRDADAKNIFVGFQKEKSRFRRITVLDDGSGIPSEMHSLIFEPRVTSRCEGFREDIYGVHGRGMALFSIRSRADEITLVSSEQGMGTSIAVMVDTNKLTERYDQATVPSLSVTPEGYEIGTGPHNVPRLLLELSLDSPETDLYIGSFAEVVSTLYHLNGSKPEEGGNNICSGLAGIMDAKRLSSYAEEKLGMPVSERNSYRILNKEIPPLETIIRRSKTVETDYVEKRDIKTVIEIDKDEIDSNFEKSRLKILKKRELEAIGEGVKTVMSQVLEQYYLRVNGSPKVKRGRGKITISINISDHDGLTEDKS